MKNLDQETSIAEKHKKTLQFIEEITTNVDQVQRQVLSEILSANANVEYLQRHGLHSHTDPQTFKKVIPVITYEDIQFDIDRIAKGDTSPIFCQQPISQFFASSGTSGGERKLIPKTDEDIEKGWSINNLVIPIVDKHIPGLDKGKVMQFMFTKPEFKTPGGLVARSLTTVLYKSSTFKQNSLFNPYTQYTSPFETIFCQDSYQSMYSQLLCGLLQNSLVVRIGCSFTYTFVQVIRFLEKHWTLICHDIRTGKIDARITDPSARDSVHKILVPNSELADLIESECAKDSWEGIVSRLWPNTKYIEVIATGSMSQYIPTVDYYSNGLPIVSTCYVSSECYFGVNLNPLCKPSEIAYTLIPTVAYFEFLPIKKNTTGTTSALNDIQEQQLQQELVDLVDVKLGEEYELVLTTYAGLYRYRVGDVLRVSSFKNNTPQFNFVCRKNSILSISGEKTDELEMQNAVNNSIKHLLPFGLTLEDYTTYADTSTRLGHYVLYWELHSGNSTSSLNVPSSAFEECCLEIEEFLNSVYRDYRVAGSIGPLEIKIVESGSFGKLMDYAVSKGASASQYKTPRCLNFGPILELINSRTISSYFSSKCPKFVRGYRTGTISKS